jgi:hypothetical protein
VEADVVVGTGVGSASPTGCNSMTLEAVRYAGEASCSRMRVRRTDVESDSMWIIRPFPFV